LTKPDPPYPTFAEFRDILVNERHCQIEPPIPNLKYSPKPVTTFTRTVGGVEVEWQAFLNDDDRITAEIALGACRALRMLPQTLNFLPPHVIDPTL
jgi:hypothetical protein